MMRPWLTLALAGLASASLAQSGPASTPLKEVSFELEREAEVIATIAASCDGCDWGRAGREAAVLSLSVDGSYSQHLVLARGSVSADYRVMLGRLAAGRHVLTLSPDDSSWAKAPRSASIARVDIAPQDPASPDHTALELAPFLYARPNTVGRFSDTPLLMWYEIDKTERGSRIRYSVIFSNEDGGTPADRLLATWGRLTDIEYVYGIEIDREGKVLEETFQGKDHEILAFEGRREGRHPLLYVVTDNNMVKDQGTAKPRFAPAPIAFDLTDVSREEVMDKNPWTYAVTAREARREGRVVTAPAPGSKQIVDPARYAVVELCTGREDTTFATFTFALGVGSAAGEPRFHESTGGVKEFRISRSPDNFPNSCFRGAVALPTGTKPSDLVALRVRAHTRPPRRGEAPAPAAGPAHLRRVNKVFIMSPRSLHSRIPHPTHNLEMRPAC
jgi:hypothetical protein